jgi:cytochrome b6-f complex iron-sulfur subunit
MEEKRFDRRRFLTLVAQGSLGAAAVVAIGQVIRFLSFEPPDSTSMVIPVGQPKNYPRNSLLYAAEARVYIGHDAQGLYALDAVCTHLGCLVERKEEGGFVCPCHDSHFDAQGRVETGPATQPLRYLHLWLDEEEGQLFVDRTQPVEPTVRFVV